MSVNKELDKNLEFSKENFTKKQQINCKLKKKKKNSKLKEKKKNSKLKRIETSSPQGEIFYSQTQGEIEKCQLQSTVVPSSLVDNGNKNKDSEIIDFGGLSESRRLSESRSQSEVKLKNYESQFFNYSDSYEDIQRTPISGGQVLIQSEQNLEMVIVYDTRQFGDSSEHIQSEQNLDRVIVDDTRQFGDSSEHILRPISVSPQHIQIPGQVNHYPGETKNIYKAFQGGLIQFMKDQKDVKFSTVAKEFLKIPSKLFGKQRLFYSIKRCSQMRSFANEFFCNYQWSRYLISNNKIDLDSCFRMCPLIIAELLN